MDDGILWNPDPAAFTESSMARFAIAQGFDPRDYASLHRWSVSRLGEFWSALWDFANVIGEKGGTAFVADESAWMTGARFFPEAQLNLAENLLRGPGDQVAAHEYSETGPGLSITRRELRTRVARVAAGLKSAGTRPGDRVAGITTNNIDGLVALLATLSIGGVWTSCSPDFGKRAILDRIGRVSPKVLFAAARSRYGGKEHDIGDRVSDVVSEIPSISALVLIGEGNVRDGRAIRHESFGTDAALEFERLPFDHPAYILYTSGTTGTPKAIVHRSGGVLLQHLKEHILHGDVRPGDRVTWYTNTAWMMYHWMVSALGAEAGIVLYDGAPILKSESGTDPGPLWRMAEQIGITHFGINPKYLSALAAQEYVPRERHALSALRSLLICGAPALPRHFDWVYRSVKSDMQFASISGGTEILGSFLIGSPLHPVRRGQLTVPALGHAVAVLDERNVPVVGRRGELACTEPFPSMPLTFWGPDGDKRYRDAYFGGNGEVWMHGDTAELTPTGGGYVHGRSDDTLKPGGVRTGVSEIYAACEAFPELDDFVAFGMPIDGDETVVLCLKPAEGAEIGAELIRRIRARIRNEASPRHVPSRIHRVGDVPYTINGKRVEGAARAAAAGKRVANKGALANPECLDEYCALDAAESL